MNRLMIMTTVDTMVLTAYGGGNQTILKEEKVMPK